MGYPLNNFIGAISFTGHKTSFLMFCVNWTCYHLNKKSINTVDRPLSGTVIWCDSIGYGFITLTKISIIAKALSILVISIDR